MTIRPYGTNRFCDKCGYHGVNIRYVPTEHYHNGFKSKEHLKLTCKQCGFAWREETRDNAEEKKEP